MKIGFLSISIIAVIATLGSCGNMGSIQQTPENSLAPEQWDVSVRTTDLEGEEPHYEAIIRDTDGKTIQVLEGNTNAYRPMELLKPFGNVRQADVNFDGYTDIMICLGIQPLCGYVTHYDAWLYNPQTGKFDYHEYFGNICNPEVDTVNKYVTNNYMLDSVTKHCIAYTIQKNGTLKELKRWQQKGIHPNYLHNLPLIIDPDKEDDYLDEKKDTANVYDVVEQMPNFPGGYHMMQDFIEKNLHYPKECAEKGIHGRVIIAVVVERSGKLTNIRVVKSIDPALDKEALRIVNLMPKWIPGRQSDKTVRVKYIIPITFQL